MFSITLKRAAATLGVVAALLAAAAPASAQSLPGMIGLNAGVMTAVPANPERKASVNASGGWDPTHALNRQGTAG